ncbi:MAG: hypothetical protein ABIF19_06190 [Planctomycetota bacterium]
MKMKCAFLAVPAAFILLATSSASIAVSTRDIDEVRKKAVLDARDFKVIDDFLAQAVQELVRTRDFTSIATIRTTILSRKGSQGQYAQQFSDSAYKHVQAGFQQAEETLRPEERKTNVIINLLILIDGMEELRLGELAVGMLKHENMVVRYWAVHCFTSSAMLQQLNSGTTTNPGTAAAVAGQLKDIVETSNPEVIALIAKFGAGVNIAQGEQLLLQVADSRIKRYADWTVEYELYDVTILKLLESKIPLPSQTPGVLVTTTSTGKPEIARRFAQLYSFAAQRYIKGKERNLLNETQKGHLATVLVEAEEKCISRLMGAPQSNIRRAIERDSTTALLDEHNKLLGSATGPGELPSKLGFDYGTDQSGAKRTAPTLLPDPPQK